MMPTSMMRPSMDSTFSSMPHSSSPRKPPVKASGMVNMTMKGDFKFWNWATITRYTSTTPTSISISISFMASIMASRSPLKLISTPSGSSTLSSAFSAASVTLVML